MRKSVAFALFLTLGLVVATTSPAVAEKAEKTQYEVMECLVQLDAEPDAWWFSGKDDRNWHVRGANNAAAEFMWNGEEWIPIGMNYTVANWNATWILVPDVGPVPVEGALWGEFAFRSDVIGDFDGTWAWGDWPDGYGRATGKGFGDDAGKNVKVTLTFDNPGGAAEPYPPPCVDPSFALFEVIDTKG